MAKFLLVCARDGAPVPDARIRRACELLVPDHLERTPPELHQGAGLTLAISSPAPSLSTHGTSMCLGQMSRAASDWWVPRAEVPDGSFALVRSDAGSVELATDALGTRSVFYVVTDRLFVASTSQRAIVAVLASFRRSAVAVSWMLSCGALGPGNSWDERIARLGPDTRVTLDRAAWSIATRGRPIAFHAERRSREGHASVLRDTVLAACDRVELDRGDWRLPLSGGYDSRLLLLTLSRRYRIPCITWGVSASENDRETDAGIARALAASVGVPHEFFAIDRSAEPFDVVFERFLRNGEGCVDLVSAYTDGFALWRRLHDAGVTGIVRGDEAFGWTEVAHESQVRPSLQATMLTDHYTSAELDRLDLAEQTWPPELQRAGGESLATWRDRLYQSYRVPVILASLTDLKASYVEVANPLLSRRILETVRTIPDALRTDKVLFRGIVQSLGPPIPFATRSAIPNYRALVGSAAFVAAARSEAIRGRDEGSLPARFVDFLLGRLTREAAATSTRSGRAPGLRGRASAAVRKRVPLYVRGILKSLRPIPQPAGVLAFRAAVVARMTRILEQDAAAGAAVTDSGTASG